MKPTISVVIPAYNEEQFISICMEGLFKQNTNRKFEVIVVDNNSTDNTAKIANGYKKKLNLKVIIEKQKGRGSARFTGFKHAQGDLILSTDADTTVPNNWVERLSTIFESDKSIEAVTGPCRIADNTYFSNVIFNTFQPVIMRVYRLFFGHYFLSGFNFAIKKDIYIKSGGFDPKLNAQEDIDLAFKVCRITKIMFYPDTCVTVSSRRFRNGFIKALASYTKTFTSYFLFRNKGVYLDDPR